jgi:hypothetical protein
MDSDKFELIMIASTIRVKNDKWNVVMKIEYVVEKLITFQLQSKKRYWIGHFSQKQTFSFYMFL